MKRNLLAFAAVTTLLATILPGAAQAQAAQENDVSYPRLTHCAALNVMLGQVLGAGEDRDKPEVKSQAQTFIAQAAALTMVAAAMNQTDPKKVQEDVFAQNEAMAQSFTREGAAQELMQRDLGPCNELGKAAYDAVENANKG